MLDKDFDAIFKSSSEDFEVAPATDSWNKISDKIDAKPVKKKNPFLWMAAASIIIVLGVGISLFTKPTATIKLHPDEDNEMMSNLAQEQKDTESVTPMEETVVNKKSYKKSERAVMISNLSDKKAPEETVIDTFTELKNEPIDSELELVKTLKPIRTKLATERLIEQEEIAKIKKTAPVTLAQMSDDTNATLIDDTRVKIPKIPSVGDLVNFVIAKVDKREEKLIKMSRTEESNNEITGINLGLFKFRKLD